MQATAPYVDRYRHIEDKRTRVYAAMVASLDDSVGRVVEQLKSIGQYDNTLIVFFSNLQWVTLAESDQSDRYAGSALSFARQTYRGPEHQLPL